MRYGYISFLIPINAISVEQRYKLILMENILGFSISTSERDDCFYGWSFECKDENIIKDFILNNVKINSDYVYWNDDVFKDDDIDLEKINNQLLRKNKLKNIQN